MIRVPSSRLVVETVARHAGLTVSQLVGPTRKGPVCRARQSAMWLLRHHCDLSYPQIARHVGRSDHTTAMHGVSVIDSLLDTDPDVRRFVTAVEAELQR